MENTKSQTSIQLKSSNSTQCVHYYFISTAVTPNTIAEPLTCFKLTLTLEPGTEIAKTAYPYLKTCEIHYIAPDLVHFYKVTREATLKNKFINFLPNWLKVNSVKKYIQNGDIDKITPFNQSIVDLQKVFITLNSLILVKQDENVMIMSCTSRSLTQKFLDSHGENVEKLGLLDSGMELLLPEMRKCVQFTCLDGSVRNLEASIILFSPIFWN